VYPGGRDAPRIALAALEAEAFVVWPRLRVRHAARRAARLLGARRLGHIRAARRRPVKQGAPT